MHDTLQYGMHLDQTFAEVISPLWNRLCKTRSSVPRSTKAGSRDSLWILDRLEASVNKRIQRTGMDKQSCGPLADHGPWAPSTEVGPNIYPLNWGPGPQKLCPEALNPKE